MYVIKHKNINTIKIKRLKYFFTFVLLVMISQVAIDAHYSKGLSLSYIIYKFQK